MVFYLSYWAIFLKYLKWSNYNLMCYFSSSISLSSWVNGLLLYNCLISFLLFLFLCLTTSLSSGRFELPCGIKLLSFVILDFITLSLSILCDVFWFLECWLVVSRLKLLLGWAVSIFLILSKLPIPDLSFNWSFLESLNFELLCFWFVTSYDFYLSICSDSWI